MERQKAFAEGENKGKSVGIKLGEEKLSKLIVKLTEAGRESFAKKFQKISTHLLTVLIIRAILQVEQRKRDKELKIQTSEIPKFQQTTPRNSPIVLIINFYHLEGDMTYDDA